MKIFTATLPVIALLASASQMPASAQSVNETHKLLPLDGSASDEFGESVAVSGTNAIIGSRWDDDNNPESGSAYVFDTVTGNQIFKLLSSDGTRGDAFGGAVAIDGNMAIIGAAYDDDNGAQSGSAYLFDVTTGTQLAKLLPSDGATAAFFGETVSISGGIAIVGAPGDEQNGIDSGAAYLFDTATGAQLAKLVPSDGEAGDWFGGSVGISGGTAVISAPFDNDNGPNSGAAYIFDTATATQTLKLLPDDGSTNDEFGCSVAINGTTVIIGSLQDDDHGANSGSAYLFDALSGIQITKLIADDSDIEDRFGSSVSIAGAIAVVGAKQEDETAINAGSAYLFDTTTGTQISKLCVSDGSAGDYAGHSVSISGTTVISGAFLNDENGESAGVAHLFEAPSVVVTAFCFGDGGGTPCPCGNDGGPGEGCANSTGSGAVLSVSGSTSISADDLVLSTTGLPGGPGLYFQGQNSINSGNGIVFGDGLRCAGLDVTRLQVRFSSGGNANTSISIATKGSVVAGETKRYQHWYRDSTNSPCGSTFNLTNGYELTWTL
jgi:hypothetical protein